ncbi:hypothetical protein [Nonomuraea gerenzanensis]|uniref:Uncharacterized protein n=1 Tax=Nonomuraea gerenzanensis TaxID=93944 RepID=A0A1M4DVL7_9ACTN|nr:hypothetical protein [Nonomuraea gerenzanensis]UBU12952.1 hypothetical protein LCN96_53375 [Nonomuraea gerenzanensis]SBO90591.1 hypothetical protein BN4615_P105 [Nonomuraea gerenzanensis]
MNVSEKNARTITLELTEDEVQELHSLIVFYPVKSSESPSDKYYKLSSKYSDAFYNLKIGYGKRADYIR